MDMNSISYSAVLARAYTVVAEKQDQCEPLGKSYFNAAYSGLGIAAAIATETFMAAMAIQANWQALSSGVDVGSMLQPLGYCVGIGMIASHAALHKAANKNAPDVSWRRWLRNPALVPVVALIGGIGVFTASTVANTTGDGDGVLGLSGIALSVAAGSLFAISFMACNSLIRVFMPALDAILFGRAKRAALKALEGQIQAAVEFRTAIDALERDLAEDEKPDALIKKVAAKVAAFVGPVAAEAHDAYVSRKAIEGQVFGPDDKINVSPDTSLEALQARAEYLKGLNYGYWYGLLKAEA